MNNLTVTINGQPAGDLSQSDLLVRAVLISLFTWRRAQPDDELPGNQRFGWWGDSYAAEPNDKIGSRLWLLTRSKLVPETYTQAKRYAEESLRWMIDDGIASRIDCLAERIGQDGLALQVTIYRHDSAPPIQLRFANLWEFLKNV